MKTARETLTAANANALSAVLRVGTDLLLDRGVMDGTGRGIEPTGGAAGAADLGGGAAVGNF